MELSQDTWGPRSHQTLMESVTFECVHIYRAGFIGRKRRTATEEKDWRHEGGQKGEEFQFLS